MKISLALALLFLAGCPTTNFHYEPLESPRRLEPKGDFAHPETGILFPWSLDGFVRAEVFQHDVDGHDVAAIDAGSLAHAWTHQSPHPPQPAWAVVLTA